uniref:ribosomal protein L18 n=1 Tax=Catenella fusiformis TaxID=3024791 RepID=UPI0027DA769E|nr:ribosomal protein L18 [Catenella fusiformis]WCH57575.1 ribosomal protein L18 [Catenella fusiformis]
MKKKIKGNTERPRLYIFRSNKHIYAQIIDDNSNKILLSSSSIAKNLESKIQLTSKVNCGTSKIIGKDIANKAIKLGIHTVVFDRGKRLYHGKIKALAEAAREKGMKF